MADLEAPDPAPPRQRGIVPLSVEDMARMAGFHDIAQRYGFAVVCQRCDQPLQGQNAGINDVFSVTCGCREYRAHIPAWRRPVS